MDEQLNSNYDAWLRRKTAVLDERYNAGYNEGIKHAALAVSIIWVCVFLIAVAAVWGW